MTSQRGRIVKAEILHFVQNDAKKDLFLRQTLLSDKEKEYREMFFVKIKIFVAYRIITKGISNGNNKSSGQKESFLRKTLKKSKIIRLRTNQAFIMFSDFFFNSFFVHS